MKDGLDRVRLKVERLLLRLSHSLRGDLVARFGAVGSGEMMEERNVRKVKWTRWQS